MAGHVPGQQLTRLPGGAPLAPNEERLVADRFRSSTIVFYLHTDVVLTNRQLHASRPDTYVVGLIPVGTERSSVPVENIAGVKVGTRFSIAGVILGVAYVVLGLAFLSSPDRALPWGPILLVLALAAIISAPKQAIEVMNRGGGMVRFQVALFERGRSIAFAKRVSEALARTTIRDIQPPTSPDRAPGGGTAGDALP